MVFSRISDTFVIKLKNPQLASKTADTKWCSYRKRDGMGQRKWINLL